MMVQNHIKRNLSIVDPVHYNLNHLMKFNCQDSDYIDCELNH